MQAELEMLLHRSCASELVSGGSEAASGHSLPSPYVGAVSLTLHAITEQQHMQTETHLMLFKGLDCCVLPHGGYAGIFILLYGEALGSSTLCSELSGPQWGEAPSPALRNEIRS